jgi:hypothetical protein
VGVSSLRRRSRTHLDEFVADLVVESIETVEHLGHRKRRIATDLDARLGAPSSDYSKETREDGDRAVGSMRAPRSQRGRDQLRAERIEHEQRMEHVLVVEAMAIAQLLGGAIGARLAIRRGAALVRVMVLTVSTGLVIKVGYDVISGW